MEMRNLMTSNKKILLQYLYDDAMEKSGSRYHRLSSLSKTCEQWSSGRTFYPILTLMIDSYNLMQSFSIKRAFAVSKHTVYVRHVTKPQEAA